MLHRTPKKLYDKLIEQTKKKVKTKFKFYVYRFLSTGELANAKPCAECTRWMSVAHSIGIIYDVYYTDDDQQLKYYDGEDSTHYIPKHTYFNI